MMKPMMKPMYEVIYEVIMRKFRDLMEPFWDLKNSEYEENLMCVPYPF